MITSYRCLVVDDHPFVCKGVRDLLIENQVCSEVVIVGNGEVALGLIQRESWDLVVLDISLPDQHGIVVLGEAKKLRPRMPIVILTLYPEREFAFRAYKAGASAYITKDQAPVELLAAVKKIKAGQPYISDLAAFHLIEHLQGVNSSENLHDLLSGRELEVLRLLGQGRTISMIAQQMRLNVKTVSTYRTRLLQKLNIETTAEAMRYALEHRLEL